MFKLNEVEVQSPGLVSDEVKCVMILRSEKHDIKVI